MTKRNCQNCKQVIGNLEESYSYYGHVICKACMIKLEKQFQDPGTTNYNIETEIPIAQERIEQDKDVQNQIPEAEEQVTADFKKETKHFDEKVSNIPAENTTDQQQQAYKMKFLKKLIKNEDFILLTIFFGLPGICVSIDEKSIWPLPICLAMGYIIFGIYCFFERIKYWRLKKSLDKLTPEQHAMLLGDIINQAKWDPDAREAVHKLLDDVGKKQESPNQ